MDDNEKKHLLKRIKDMGVVAIEGDDFASMETVHRALDAVEASEADLKARTEAALKKAEELGIIGISAIGDDGLSAEEQLEILEFSNQCTERLNSRIDKNKVARAILKAERAVTEKSAEEIGR